MFLPVCRNKILIRTCNMFENFFIVEIKGNIVYDQRYMCVRACVRACMHVCERACVHVCVHVCMCACVCACMHACMHVCACVRVRVCVC